MLTYEEVVLDQKLCQKLEKDKVKLSTIATKFERYQNALNDKKEFQNLLGNSSKEEQNQIIKEISCLSKQIDQLSLELSNLLKEQNSTDNTILVLIQHNNDYTSELLQKDIVLGYSEFCNEHNLNAIRSENKNTIELKISGTSAKEYLLNLDAKSAILMDATTGTVLYEHNADEALPPASVMA